MSLAHRLSEQDPYQIDVNVSSEKSSDNYEGCQELGIESTESMSFSTMTQYEAVAKQEGPGDVKNVPSNRALFDRTFNDEGNSGGGSSESCLPSKEVIQNYCKNVILSSKMEKEVPIVALVYIERLVLNSGFGVSERNWHRIVLTALILASKIWDDESFENENFAQALPLYSTQQINEMERVFLDFINYKLYIKCKDYAKYYFVLRTFAEKKKKSFPLRPLDLMTVIRLQNNSDKAERIMKEQYEEPLNKSL